jgi:hypothetical protein
MIKRTSTGLAVAASLIALAAWQTSVADQKPARAGNTGKQADTETLQKATTLAVGNLAWESVKISDVQRDATTVKWLATTRSMKLNCAAAPDGTNPFC